MINLESIVRLGTRLKRRLKNLLLITAVGLGTFYGYRGYQRRQWFHNMSDSDASSGKKPRVIVLGTGEAFEPSRFDLKNDFVQVGAPSPC